MSPSLSVAMMARDEAEVIGRSLSSVAWADERVVVDSGSRDGTPDVAREHGARVVVADDWRGYGLQRRRSLAAVRGDWVLFLDADEVVTPELAAEIRELLAKGPGADGYEIHCHTRFLGHWFGRRGWHREWHLRLARREAAEVTPDLVHEEVRVAGDVGRLRHPFLHYTYRDVEHHQRKALRYARLKAEKYHAAGRSTGLAGAVAHSAGAFLRSYLLRGRFLDGWPGLVWATLGAHSTLLAYLRLWELGRGAGDGREAGDGRAAGDE